MTLFVGHTTRIEAQPNVVVLRPGNPSFDLTLDLMATGPVSGVKGVQIGVKPNSNAPDGGSHSGVVFNASGPWQGTVPPTGSMNPLWSHGRGFIFFPDGTIMYEQWFTTNGAPDCATRVLPGDWRTMGGLLATATTYQDGSGSLGLYKTDSLGGNVQALVAAVPFVATEQDLCRTFTIPVGDYAAGFAIGPQCSADFRPRALYY